MITGFFAGMVDTISGGGGLIALPMLIGLGLPITTAIGTNRLQGIIGELVALFRFIVGYKVLDLSKITWALVVIAISASLGALVVMRIHPDILNKCIPFLLLAILLYIVFRPQLGRKDIQQRISPIWFYGLFAVVIGFYNGFFGPGTGSFWVFALMYCLGLNQQRATIQMKPLNLVGNVASILWFIFASKVDYVAVLAMAVGQIFAAYFSTYLVVSKGYKVIRPLFIVIVAVMTIDLFVKNFFV